MKQSANRAKYDAHSDKLGGGPRPQKAPKSPFFKGPFGVLGGKKGTFGALIFFALFH